MRLAVVGIVGLALEVQGHHHVLVGIPKLQRQRQLAILALQLQRQRSHTTGGTTLVVVFTLGLGRGGCSA